MAKYDLTNFFQTTKKAAQGNDNSKAVVSGWKFEAPVENSKVQEQKIEAPQAQEQKATEVPQVQEVQKTELPKQEQQSLVMEEPQIVPQAEVQIVSEPQPEVQKFASAEVIKEALQEKPIVVKKVPILGLPSSPSPSEVMPGRTTVPFQSTVRIGMQEIKDDIAAAAESPSAAEQASEANGKTGQDEYIAQAMHELVMASGWSPTKTTPEKDYYFFAYMPPEHKRMWMQARVYISKLNLNKSLRIEGLTIPTGMEGRLIVIIRTQKSGGIDRLANSKTVTQSLDTHNYFNQKGELVNPDGLRAVLSSYLKQAEIL